jgi:hypothetical protein
MQSYCAGANIFTNATCTSWAASNPSLAYDIQQTYCDAANIYSDSNCKTFALSEAAAGKIDSTMDTYCQEYPTDSLCACINSPIVSCPQQYSTPCRQTGYQTNAMLTTTCPTVMNCQQYNTLSPEAISIAENTDQNCSITTNITDSTTGVTTSTTTGQTTQNGVTMPISAAVPIVVSTGISIYIWIAFFLIILIVIVTAVLLMPDDESDKKYKEINTPLKKLNI